MQRIKKTGFYLFTAMTRPAWPSDTCTQYPSKKHSIR